MAQDGKSQMNIWNEALTTKEKVDKAVKNLLRSEAEYEAIIQALTDKGVTKDNLEALKVKPKYKAYKTECLKRALEGFGKEDAEAIALEQDEDLDFIKE